jgi:predicted SAM-dependent methyltransferase
MNEGLKLNIGCGINKLVDFINIDCDSDLNPDLVHKLPKPLPYEGNSCDLIVMYHTIEHIEKRYHTYILLELWRLIKPDGLIIITYPNFLRCVEHWKNNHKGMRVFWEAAIYGRQASSSDYHVCIMDDEEFSRTVVNCGFEIIKIVPEEDQPFNTIMKLKKHSMHSYELDVQDAVWAQTQVK